MDQGEVERELELDPEIETKSVLEVQDMSTKGAEQPFVGHASLHASPPLWRANRTAGKHIGGAVEAAYNSIQHLIATWKKVEKPPHFRNEPLGKFSVSFCQQDSRVTAASSIPSFISTASLSFLLVCLSKK